VRDNIARDWNHITETVVSLGVPELADVVGGQMFAGANSMTTSTTNQAYHLADHIAGFTDKELQHIITVIAGWPGDSGGSESLSKILHGLDYAAAGRCPSWEEGVRLKLALIWATFAFRPVHVQFCRSTLELASPSLGSFSLKHLMQYLLLVSYRAEDKDLVLDSLKGTDSLEAMAASIDKSFLQLSQTEAAVVYSALHHLSPETAAGLGARIHSTYGFRL